MVCQTECMRRVTKVPHSTEEITRSLNLQVKLPEYPSRVGWRLDVKALADKRFEMIKIKAAE